MILCVAYENSFRGVDYAGGGSAGVARSISRRSELLAKAHGGLTRENGDRFRATLLSRGGSAEAMSLFRNFVGRDPYIEPLLERRGLEKAPIGEAAPPQQAH